LHAFASDDRGWHLRAVLSRAAPRAQRISLSATVGDPEKLVAWFAPEPRRAVSPAAVVRPMSQSRSILSDRLRILPP
jgi:ATP-dependent helicase Lhr and Lhr-like helicase